VFKLNYGSKQSPKITKIASSNQSINYLNKENNQIPQINVAQKKKVPTSTLDKNKISQNNKSIVKLSILNQPNIKKVKQQKKAIRNTRRRKISEELNNEKQNDHELNDNEEIIIDEPYNTKENTKDSEMKNNSEINNGNNNESNNGNNKNNVINIIDEHRKINNENNTKDVLTHSKSLSQTKQTRKRSMTDIQMLESGNKFSIIKEANNLFPKISLAQLLSISPTLRKELGQGCKPKIDNVLCSLYNIPIPIFIGKTKEVFLKILYDTGANVNVITTGCLNKFNDVKIEEDIIEQNITLANGSTVPTKYYVPLKININDSCNIYEKFYIINQDNPYFDIIFGRSIQKKYRLLIDPDDDFIYQKTRKGLKKIIQIINSNNTNNIPLMNAIYVSKEDEEIREFNSTLNEILNSVPDKVKSKFESLINQYKNCMATSLSQLTTANLEPHSIITTTEKPIKLKPYKLSKEHSDILKEEIISLLNKRLIIPSHSPWSFPVLLVRKKNGKWRLCIDYRRLNEITIKDSYALPFIDELVSSVRGAKIFSALDLYSGYHQIPMNPRDIEKTSFTTKFGNYNFVVMPFGLTNAPATFQREMNRILLPLIGKCLFVYIDDIVVYSTSIEEHLEHLKQVFEIFSKYNLSLNLQKCKFFQESIEVLGHVLTPNGLKTVPSKVQSIALWEAPKNVNELRSFLGLASYYRKFIQNFSIRADSLFKLLKKNQPYIWTSDRNEAFEDIRHCLLSDPILCYPDFDKEFIVRTDASTQGIGAVLLQVEEDKLEHPICCVSRTLSPPERNYSVTDLEGLAINYAIQKFRQYLISNKKPTIFITDHKPLLGFYKNTIPNKGRHMRWIEEFNKYKIELKYEKGKKNVFADALSRLPSKDSEDIIKCINTILADLNPKDLNLPEGIIKYFTKNYQVVDNILYYKKDDTYLKVIYRDEDKKDIINRAHSVGHEGAEKTVNRILNSYYWPGIWNDVRMWIKSCRKCQLCRPKPIPKNTADNVTPVEQPFTRVGLDTIGPLPITKNGNMYIITLVDYFTKWVEAKAIPNTKTEEVIKFLTEVISRHGPPEIIVTDNGSSFASDITKMMIDLYGSWVHFVSPHHPESNGMIENRNREVEKILRLLIENESEWDEYLPSALWALRTTKNSKTKFSSFELLYGRKDTWPLEVMFPDIYKDPNETDEEYIFRRFLRHQNWVKQATEYSDYANQYWEHRIGLSKSLKKNYKPGDYVMIRLIGRSKLNPYFYGPYKVVNKQKFNTVVLEDPQTGKLLDRNVHIKNVFPYIIPEKELTSRDEVQS